MWYLIVCATAGEDGAVVLVPLKAGHRRRVVFERCHRVGNPAEISQIPNFNQSVVAARDNERIAGIPVDDVYVGEVRVTLRQHAGLAGVGTHVPNLNCSITGAGRHNVLLVRRPSSRKYYQSICIFFSYQSFTAYIMNSYRLDIFVSIDIL